MTINITACGLFPRTQHRVQPRRQSNSVGVTLKKDRSAELANFCCSSRYHPPRVFQQTSGSLMSVRSTTARHNNAATAYTRRTEGYQGQRQTAEQDGKEAGGNSNHAKSPSTVQSNGTLSAMCAHSCAAAAALCGGARDDRASDRRGSGGWWRAARSAGWRVARVVSAVVKKPRIPSEDSDT